MNNKKDWTNERKVNRPVLGAFNGHAGGNELYHGYQSVASHWLDMDIYGEIKYSERDCMHIRKKKKGEQDVNIEKGSNQSVLS